MALRTAKKDQDEESVGNEVPDGDRPVRLRELTDRLGELGQLLDKTNRQVVAYLVERESQVAAAEEGGLSEKLDALIDQLAGTVAGEGPEDPLGEVLCQIRDGNSQQHMALADGIRQLQQRLDAGLQELADRLRMDEPDEPDESAAGPAANANWQRAILGAELAEKPGLDSQRLRLLDGTLAGDPDACSLVGQLLIFRSAAADKMPPLLKDLGEAFYRWQPKTRAAADPMEEALVDWLRRTLQEAGIPNTIELVHPGERFDAARHTAAARGVEITEARGWIVLRDNGKVYTKAQVAVR